ncbi:MAG: glycosyltransferase [Acidobacteriia bacterium]|nr:glycosyltransferase [Terriglobia bacterium]
MSAHPFASPPGPNSTRPELSIVTTLYKSAPFIKRFYAGIQEAAERIAVSYEILFVNDGSPDQSLAMAVALAQSDPRVRVVDLSRNFGHHAAILAGLRHSRGEFVFLIDVDLEERPEWLLDFWEDMRNGPVDMVYGVQTARTGAPVKRYTGAVFYRLFNLLSETRIPANVCTVRLMSRRYVDAVSQLTEAHVFLAGLFAWAGFAQRPRAVTKVPRETASSYTPLRLIQLFVNAITSFSSYPLTLVFFAGALLTFFSLGYAAWLLAVKIRNPQMVLSGFTSMMVSLWLLGGMLLSVLGLIGMYIGKIFVETKGRPQYVIKRVYEACEAAPEHD